MRDDEREPLFDDYARSERRDNRSSTVAILGVCCLFLLAGLGVTTYMWRHDATALDACENNGTMTTPTSAPMPSPTSGPSPTPAPTTKDGYPAAWDAIAAEVLSSMNRSADPCNDFYQYACGGWLANNTIPTGESRYARAFDKLAKETEAIEAQIVRDGWPLVGDVFTACANTQLIDGQGAKPIQPMLTALAAAKFDTPEAVATQLAFVAGEGVNALFSFGSSVDAKDPAHTIAEFDQGGFMLPRPTYLNATDPDNLAQLKALENYAAALFTLMGAPFSVNATDKAATVIQLQTELARISMGREERRDPYTVYNKIGLDALQNLTKSIDFTRYVGVLGVRKGWNTNATNVGDPNFFAQLDTVVEPLMNSNATGNTILRDVLAFNYVASYATSLSAPFRQAHLNFTAALTGVAEAQPRNTFCLQTIDSTSLGMLVGHYFVQQEFKQATKEAAQALVKSIESVFGERMHHVQWLANSSVALAAAEAKLAAVTNQIGFPDKWRSYGAVSVSSTAHFANMQTLRQLAAKEDALKVDSVTDKSQWEMLPQQINAYYEPVFNEMVFPAGILRGSFYQAEAPLALNHGGIGGVMGHELTHGFDDQGNKFDAKGALHPWWPKEVAAAFTEHAKCVVELYSSFSVQSGNETVHCNGNVTLGENLADLGGIANSYRSYMAQLQNNSALTALENKIPDAFDGLTKEQLYFVGWGQNWCTLQTTAALKRQIATDVHSPGEIRVLGPCSQTPEFADAFQCKPGDRYAPKERCTVW